MENCEARRRRDGRNGFYYKRWNSHQRFASVHDEAQVSRKQAASTDWTRYWLGLEKCRTLPYKYRFLRQGITLKGFQTPTFAKATEAIRVIHSHFDRQFQEGTLEEQAKDSEGSEDVDQVGMWNRYFTPMREAMDMQAVVFLPGVDPVGTLRGMAQEDSSCTYIHTEDNQVRYYITRRDNSGDIMWLSPEIKDEDLTLMDDRWSMIND